MASTIPVDSLPDRRAQAAIRAQAVEAVEYTTDDASRMTQQLNNPHTAYRGALNWLDNPVPSAPDLSRRGEGH